MYKVLLFLLAISVIAEEVAEDEIVFEKVFADVRGQSVDPKSDGKIDPNIISEFMTTLNNPDWDTAKNPNVLFKNSLIDRWKLAQSNSRRRTSWSFANWKEIGNGGKLGMSEVRQLKGSSSI